MKAIFIILVAFLCSSFGLNVEEEVAFAVRQYTTVSSAVPYTGAFIHNGDPLSPTWRTTDQWWWTCGFYSGTLWMLYKHTGDTKWRDLAIRNQDGLFANQFDRGTHDLGFIIMSSYGHGLEMTGIENYKNFIVQAATSLAGRYFPLGGVIRSWNNGNNEFDEVKVIIDNMMNLELLFKAAEFTGDQFYSKIAITHADRTIAEHFRPDGGSYHVVSFYETTGGVKVKWTAQGYSTSSTWARGQAWGIYGFTTTYKYTNQTRYLAIAEKAADYFISRLEPDFVPQWDFDAPKTSYQPRDTSAATIAACAFFELHTITSKPHYLSSAVNILESLVANYRVDRQNPANQIPAIFVNGTVYFNQGDYDTSIVYGDYYFLRALDLYKKIVPDV